MKPVEIQPVFLLYAFRYALGRSSYATFDVGEALIAWRAELTPDWRRQIAEDIERAIDGGYAGMQMDAEMWANVARVMREEGVAPAPKFTGFWEAQGEGLEPEVRTTLGPVALDDIMRRLYERLLGLVPGALVRIDLISWAGEGEAVAPPSAPSNVLELNDAELDALWRLLVTGGDRGGALNVRVIDKVQRLVERNS